uniref:Lysine demethylase 1B n=1 Tax=Felis catus TaxID=9685 RepID=A0ABI7YX97_FELCA
AESKRINSVSRGGGSVDLCSGCARLGPSLIPAPGSLRPTQEVPDPTKYFVTRWSTDPWIQMAYSFVKTGGSGEAYDILAEEIQGMVFFAGEATNRHFPQTVTGAYLSGVREASKIAAF